MLDVSYAKRLAYCANARNLGRRWRDFSKLACVVAVLLVLALLPIGVPGRQFVLGIGIGALVMAMILAAARVHDPQVAGYAAETYSVDALRRARGWTVFDNVPFDRVDIDHVVITPAAILAVETKWHGPSATPALARQRGYRDLEAARSAARKLRLLLRSYGLHDAAAVTPVLMVWGPGAPDLAEGFRFVDGCYVVDGEHPYLWRHRFSAPLIGVDTRTALTDALRDFARRRRNHAAANEQPLRRQLLTEFRAGVRAERDARLSRDVLRRSVRRRHGSPTLVE